MNINFTLVMQAVAFAAFIWFTSRFVWPHLMRAIDRRQKQIAAGLAAGEQGRKDLASAEKRAADMLAEYRAAVIAHTGIDPVDRTSTDEIGFVLCSDLRWTLSRS